MMEYFGGTGTKVMWRGARSPKWLIVEGAVEFFREDEKSVVEERLVCKRWGRTVVWDLVEKVREKGVARTF